MEQRRRKPKRDTSINGGTSTTKSLRRKKGSKGDSDITTLSSNVILMFMVLFAVVFLLGYVYFMIGIVREQNESAAAAAAETSTTEGNEIMNANGLRGKLLAFSQKKQQQDRKKTDAATSGDAAEGIKKRVANRLHDKMQALRQKRQQQQKNQKEVEMEKGEKMERFRGVQEAMQRIKQHQNQKVEINESEKMEGEEILLQPAAKSDDVASFLLELVRMSSNELRRIFENDGQQNDSGKKDPFNLAALERGECPHVDSSTMDWLPPKLPNDASALFQKQQAETDKDQIKRKVAIWFEHLSKAGGTSMCNLANANMPTNEVPDYHCMPSEPGMVDARVGQWTNLKLKNYIKDEKKHIVSNEWEPFPLEKLNMRPSSNNDDNNDPWLIFVSTIRHPLNRLVSAYKFWGILHNESKKKPTLAQFLQRREARARNDFQNPKGLGKHLGANDDFLAMIGRPNFAMWKFSGGKMPLPESIGGAVPWSEIEDDWVDPFLVAVKTLCQYDLVIPMELLSTTHETKNGLGVGPLHDLLGWDNFEDSHVVPSGVIINNNAKESDLSKEEYDELWDNNRMDMVIYFWTRAVYLTRIHCASRLRA